MTIAGNSRICRSILLTITIFSLSLPAYAKYSGGTGEPNDPYQIATATDLIALGETPEDYDKHFILTADIDLDPNLPGRKVFDRAVIAPDSDPRNSFQGGPFFTGVFDGNRHRILHLTIKGGNNIGLFSCLGCSSNTRSGEVKNLGVVDVSITGSGNCLGGLAGSNLGIIRRCYSTGTVSGSRSNWYGGVGGLIGGNGGEITDCYSTSTVSGDRDVGGLVGGNLLYWPGPFQYSGYSQGLVARCFSTGEVTGIECVGGLVGANGGEVNNCYSTSTVSGENAIGGLVGDNRAWVSNVDISYDVYGLVARCYSTGAVTGTSFVGGLVGGYVDRSFYEGIVSHSFWDMQTSGQATSEGGTGLTTNAMENIQTYQIAGWDLTGEIANGTHETWQVPEEGGYPVLTAFSGYAPPELQGQGTMEDPYLISDAMDLGAIIHYSPSAYYRLSASIDLSDIHWNTSVIPHLEGTFDGNGHAIRNLNIVGGGCLGLFGQIGCSAKASNLALEVVDVNGTGYSVGGLAGSNYGNISRSYSTGSVNGDSGVGGLVGTNSGNMISCYSTSSVTGGGYSRWIGGGQLRYFD